MVYWYYTCNKIRKYLEIFKKISFFIQIESIDAHITLMMTLEFISLTIIDCTSNLNMYSFNSNYLKS